MHTTTTDMNKALIRSYYEGSVNGDVVGFGAQLHRDFVCSTPRYLPWGGDVHGAVAFIAHLLPQIARVLDFGRFSFDSLLAEGDRVVASIDFWIRDTRASVKVSEHWRLDAGKVLSLWAAYFEPAALLAR